MCIHYTHFILSRLLQFIVTAVTRITHAGRFSNSRLCDVIDTEHYSLRLCTVFPRSRVNVKTILRTYISYVYNNPI